MRTPRKPAAAPKSPAKTPVEILIDLGRKLHGEHWIGPTARDLDIAQRTVANWAVGKSRLREGPILDALRLLVGSHAAAVARAREIAKSSIPGGRPPL
jgi:hypothetical protein